VHHHLDDGYLAGIKLALGGTLVDAAGDP